MDSFLKTLPWEAQAIIYLLTVAVVFFATYSIPFRWLQVFGKWPGCSANWISIWRVPITWAGFFVFEAYGSYWGVLIVSVGLMMDFLDGRVAAALQLLDDPAHPGVTEIGKALDPAADKGCTVPFFLFKAMTAYFSLSACIAMAVFELIGTLIRPPFIKLKVWPFRNIRRRIRKSAATGVGKVKMAMQCVVMVLTAPYTLGWWDPNSTWWFDWAIWGIVILAGASVASRLKFHKDVDEAVDSFTGVFNHVNGVLGFLKNGNINGKGALPGAKGNGNGKK